jgi:Putative peptidoglycan binding domain
MSNEVSSSFDRAPVAGKLDLSQRHLERGVTGSSPGYEISTEPSEQELAADRQRDQARDRSLQVEAAAPVGLWPTQDRDSPEYAHLTDTVATTSFDVTPQDLETLIAANRFKPEGQSNVIALAIRGSVLQQPHEQEKQSAIGLSDVRPNHRDFRCTLGFYYRDLRQLTLFTGSTVPCPKYIENHFNRVNGLPHTSNTGCNMMPSGCYVSRVGSHAGGTIRPALRTTNPDDMHSDAVVTVLRTEDDLKFSFGARDRWDPTTPYDNVHCSYFINFDPSHKASFSSAGCLTVRGRKDPSHQWEKYQAVLRSLGQEKRIDLLLLTGREYAIAAMLRNAGLLTDEPTVRRELVRLRVGAQGEEVRRLQAKLGVASPTGYFGPATKKALTVTQKQNGHPPDGVYSPKLDQALGWGVFDVPIV